MSRAGHERGSHVQSEWVHRGQQNAAVYHLPVVGCTTTAAHITRAKDARGMAYDTAQSSGISATSSKGAGVDDRVESVRISVEKVNFETVLRQVVYSASLSSTWHSIGERRL